MLYLGLSLSLHTQRFIGGSWREENQPDQTIANFRKLKQRCSKIVLSVLELLVLLIMGDKVISLSHRLQNNLYSAMSSYCAHSKNKRKVFLISQFLVGQTTRSFFVCTCRRGLYLYASYTYVCCSSISARTGRKLEVELHDSLLFFAPEKMPRKLFFFSLLLFPFPFRSILSRIFPCMNACVCVSHTRKECCSLPFLPPAQGDSLDEKSK